MQKIRILTLCLLSLSWSKWAASDIALPTEVREWVESTASDHGRLLTPVSPGTAASEHALEAQKYVTDLLLRQTAAGQKLAQQGIIPILSIFESNSPAAHAAEITVGGKRYAQIGITTGLLKRLKTRGGLAFVLAHEATHVLRKDTQKPGWSRDRWWSSQGTEVQADAGAIDLLAGHQNLDDAIEPLLEFAEESPSDSISDLLSTHHYESLRIAAVQAEADGKLRTLRGVRTSSVPLPPLLTDLADLPRVRELQSLQVSVARTAFRTAPTELWIQERMRTVCPDPLCHSLKELTGEDAQAAFLRILPELERASITPEQKLAAFFNLISFQQNKLTGNGMNDAALAFLSKSPEALNTLKRLASQGDPASLLQFATRDRIQFAQLIDGGPVAAMITQAADQEPKRWKSFFEKLPTLYLENESHLADFTDLHHLESYLAHTTDPKSKPFRERLAESTRRYLERMSPSLQAEAMERAAQGHAPGGYIQAFNSLYGKGDPTRTLSPEAIQLREGLRPLLPAYEHKQLEALRNAVASGKPDVIFAHYAVTREQGYLRIPPELERQALDVTVLRANEIPPYLFDPYGGESAPSWCSELLLKSEYPLAARLDLLKRLISARARSAKDLAEPATISKNIQTFLSRDAPTGTLVSLLSDPLTAPLMTLLSPDVEVRRALPHEVSAQAAHSLLEAAFRSPGLAGQVAGKTILPRHTAELLLNLLAEHLNDPPISAELVSLYSRLYPSVAHGLDSRPGLRSKLQKAVLERMEALSLQDPQGLRRWMRDPAILGTLEPSESARLIAGLLPRSGSRSTLAAATKSLAAEMRLPVEHFEVYSSYRRVAAERFEVQPDEVRKFFPEAPYRPRDLANDPMLIRGLSAIASETQAQPLASQLEMLLYLMGERAEPPNFVYRIADKYQTALPFVELLERARARIRTGGTAERVFVLDSLLAGQKGMAGSQEGISLLMSHFLDRIPDAERTGAREVAEAILRAYGARRSLAVSYMLAADSGSKATSQGASLLRGVLRAHGMPGDKLGQYLAFTIPSLRKSLGDLQDDTTELSFYDSASNLAARYGKRWPKRYKLIGTVGAGSGNGAYLLLDTQTSEKVVASSLYPGLESATEEDFARVRDIVDELSRTPEGRAKYGHLRDLMPLIQDSVNLEFDKVNAHAALERGNQVYRGELDGWKIRTVRAVELGPGTLVMGLAPGKTARKVLEENPEAYRSALRAWSKFEYRVLTEGGDRTLVNVDVHDGQLLIDESARTITLIDPGQTLVAVSRKDVDLGKRLLRAVSGIDSQKATLTWINRDFGRSGVEVLAAADLDEILSDEDRMSRFVRLVGKLRARGAEVSLGAANWAQAINREVQLARKVGAPIDRQIATLLLADKAKVPTPIYNRVHRFLDATVRSTCVRRVLDLLSRQKLDIQ